MRQSGNWLGMGDQAAAYSDAPGQKEPVEIDALSVEQIPGINRYLSAMIRFGPSCFIDNAPVEMKALLIDGKVLPIVIAEPGSGKAGICSAHSHYVLYTLWSLKQRHTFLLRPFFEILLRSFGLILRLCQVDRAIYINNWLFPTNPVMTLSCDQVKRITDYLVRKYPKYAVIHRTVNPALNYRLCRNLLRAGFSLIRSRTVYLADTRSTLVRRSSDLKKDLKLLQSTPYSSTGKENMSSEDPGRMEEIYRGLYMDRYCSLNPNYNKRFFSLIMKTSCFKFRLFRKEGRIDAFTLYYHNDGHLTGMLLGYDLGLPRQTGLYRMALTWKFQEAFEEGLVVNLSGGVGEFKRHRGAASTPEYDAFYDLHLPLLRKLPWRLLRLACSWAENRLTAQEAR